MALARYANPDPYTLEELRREYQSSDYRGRTRLLRRLKREVERDVGIPSEIIELAVADEYAQVRQWVARFVYLDEEHLGRLKEDPDEFVRACLWENPSRVEFFWLSDQWLKAFEASSHLERLAMVRNPRVNRELIEKIFDLDDQQLGLTMEARAQLASAFLANERVLNREAISFGEWNRRIGEVDASGYIDYHRDARKHFDRLWALASKWPPQGPTAIDFEAGVRYWTYHYVGADDKTKAEAYKNCEASALRRAILKNTRTPIDPHGSSFPEDPSASETTKLGLGDSDYECRKLAVDRARPPHRSKKSRYISYGWSVLWFAGPRAIGIGLAVKSLSLASTNFETIVFALFILLYGSVAWMMASSRQRASEQRLISTWRYLNLIELLNDPSYTKETKQTLYETLRKEEEAVSKNDVLLILQSIWCAILVAIALYYLVPLLA